MPNEIAITNLSNNCTYDMPFDLEVTYTAEQSGLEVAVVYSGYSDPPEDAPQPGGDPSFDLDWAGTVSSQTVTVILRLKASPGTVLASDYRTGLTFLGGPP